METAFFNHVYTRYYRQSVGFSYWRRKRGCEVDIVADIGRRLVPFEVKYRTTTTGAGALKGLAEFCEARNVDRAYAITKDIRDFGVMPLTSAGGAPRALKVPAPLACYWLGQSELEPDAGLAEDE